MTELKQGLEVAGYRPQPQVAIDLVNYNKRIEEETLRALDHLAQLHETIDMRWLAIARTHIEQGWMAANRAIFRPTRIKLDGDKT